VNKALELGCKDYKEQISTLNDTISANQVTINILNSNLEHAYRLIAETVEALNMLKYDKELGYGVKLTEEADTLLKAIERHSLRFLNRNNQQDLAEQVKSTAKISEYIQNIIDELNPPPTATKDKSYDLSL
jgi:hypothetical protein